MKPLFEIPWDKEAIFLERTNRFLAICNIEGQSGSVKVHVRDPGRLKELLFPGNRLLLKRAKGKPRKTSWDLISALSQDGKSWVLVNSGFHSSIASAIFEDEEISPFKGIREIKKEVKFESSRLDFLLTLESFERIYIEVKGCTLERSNIALFPDAPTERGRRHLKELIKIREEKGERSAICFLIFCPNVNYFSPNWNTDREFSRTFYEAIKKGVECHPFLLEYKKGMVNFLREIPFLKEKSIKEDGNV